MAVISEYAEFDGLGLAEQVKAGEISENDVLDTVFHLIDELNPFLNAVVRPLEEEARSAVEAGLSNGPFRGTPMVLKDEYVSVAGIANDHSSRLGAGVTRNYDTSLVESYRSAGIVFVGKANLPELGASATTSAKLYGPCSTPWDLARNSGGSSGGSASAVAAGIVPVAYSNDGGGSIRIPASCCGAFGLKPMRARVSTAPDGGEYWNGLVIEHAITRSVRDSAALLDASDGPKLGDYCAAPPKARPFLEEVGAEVGRLRIAVSAKPPFQTEVSSDCVAAMEDAAALCEALGHHVEEDQPIFDGEQMWRDLTDLKAIHLAFGVDELAQTTGRQVSPDTVENVTLSLAERGRKLGAVHMLAILERNTLLARKLAPFWESYDLLLTPTLALPPVPHDYIYTDDPDPERFLARSRNFLPFTQVANILGAPAMSVPLFWTSEGLPIGTHFIARVGDEATLFRLAAQLEEARPWSKRRPPVSAWNVLS